MGHIMLMLLLRVGSSRWIYMNSMIVILSFESIMSWSCLCTGNGEKWHAMIASMVFVAHMN